MITEISDIILNSRDSSYSNGVSDECICITEKEMQMTFSQDYRSYLKCFGVAIVNGHELTGLNCDNRVNVKAVTRDAKTRDSNVPQDWYVVEDTHIDDIIVWQDQEGDIYLKSPYTKPKKICNSLSEYLDM